MAHHLIAVEHAVLATSTSDIAERVFRLIGVERATAYCSAVTRRFGVVVVVLVAAAFTLTYVFLQRANEPHRASEVATIIEHGAISQAEAHRGDFNDDAFALLPDPLPAPRPCASQQPGMVPGASLELILASGEHLEYGGCPHQSDDTSLPVEFWPVWCRLIDAPLPKADTQSCGDT